MTVTPDSLGVQRQGQVVVVLSAEDTFAPLLEVRGDFNLSIIPLTHEDGSPITAFDGKVTLERAFLESANDIDLDDFIPPTESLIWNVVSEHTTLFEGYDYQPEGAIYRIGIKTGDYVEGQVMIRLGK